MVKILIEKIHCEGVKWLFEIALFNSNQYHQSMRVGNTKWVVGTHFYVYSTLFFLEIRKMITNRPDLK